MHSWIWLVFHDSQVVNLKPAFSFKNLENKLTCCTTVITVKMLGYLSTLRKIYMFTNEKYTCSIRKVKDVITFFSQYSRNFPFLGKHTWSNE